MKRKKFWVLTVACFDVDGSWHFRMTEQEGRTALKAFRAMQELSEKAGPSFRAWAISILINAWPSDGHFIDQ